MRRDPEIAKLMDRSRPQGADDLERAMNFPFWIIDGKIDPNDASKMIEPELPLARMPMEESPDLGFVHSEALVYPGLRIKTKIGEHFNYIPISVAMVTYAIDKKGEPVVIFTDSRNRFDLRLPRTILGSPNREREMFNELAMLVEARDTRSYEEKEYGDEESDEEFGNGLPEVGDLKYLDGSSPRAYPDDTDDVLADELDEIEDGIDGLLRDPRWPAGVITRLVESGIYLPDAYFYAFGKSDQRVSFKI